MSSLWCCSPLAEPAARGRATSWAACTLRASWTSPRSWQRSQFEMPYQQSQAQNRCCTGVAVTAAPAADDHTPLRTQLASICLRNVAHDLLLRACLSSQQQPGQASACCRAARQAQQLRRSRSRAVAPQPSWCGPYRCAWAMAAWLGTWSCSRALLASGSSGEPVRGLQLQHVSLRDPLLCLQLHPSMCQLNAAADCNHS